MTPHECLGGHGLLCLSLFISETHIKRYIKEGGRFIRLAYFHECKSQLLDMFDTSPDISTRFRLFELPCAPPEGKFAVTAATWGATLGLIQALPDHVPEKFPLPCPFKVP